MVAVGVVPSPATSLVFWATALTSLAQPHVLERVGQVNFLGDRDAVLGHGGPAEALVEDDVSPGRLRQSVTPTAWASLSAPANSFLRASSVYSNCFAMCGYLLLGAESR